LQSGEWSGVRGFEALPKHQFMNESTNINSLADNYIWSTIKTLPATLLEPRSVVRGPSFEAQVPRFEVQAPGLLEPFLPQIWMSVGGGGGYKGLGSCGPDLGCGIGGGGSKKFYWGSSLILINR